jgi:Ferritin-like
MNPAHRQLSTPYPVPALSNKERTFVAEINAKWNKQMAHSELRSALQAAVEVELATIPIYLFTYYSIQRTVGDSAKPPVFPHTAVSRFADKAGAFIMSVAVEEMLHMSLSSNILFALGQMPVLFGKSPTFPASLPGHSPHGPNGGRAAIDLAPLSEAHLRQFLLIEYPAPADAKPEGADWDTIGQIYSYIRCIISSQWISDADFHGNRNYQIQSGNYSPNSIDTIYPDAAFNKATPVPAGQPGSASKVAKYASREDSHVGSRQLLQISSREEALQAIATIDFEGEGFGPTKFDDPSHGEYSHYWKFLTVQSHLAGYSKTGPDIAPLPLPPEPVVPAITSNELHSVVFNFPKNPTTTMPVAPHNIGYTDPFDRDIVDLSSALYTYMLIMTETLFKVPAPQQKLFFNQTLHMSMIWLLDKYCQAMRTIYMNSTAIPSTDPDGKMRLAPSFQNFPFSSRALAHGEMAVLGMAIETKYANDPRYSAVGWLVTMISGNATTPPVLPDVAKYWMP